MPVNMPVNMQVQHAGRLGFASWFKLGRDHLDLAGLSCSQPCCIRPCQLAAAVVSRRVACTPVSDRLCPLTNHVATEHSIGIMSACTSMVCSHINIDRLSHHSCLFRRPVVPCLRLRLKHYYRATQRPLRTSLRAKASTYEGMPDDLSRHSSNGAGFGRYRPRFDQSTGPQVKQVSLAQQLLSFMKRLGLAALLVVLGLGRALSARAR